MGVRLIVEVLDHAPADLTPAELVVLVVLAEQANDTTRQCWPGLELIARRARMHPDTLRRMFARWALRWPPIDVRVPIAMGRDGRIVYSAKGRRTLYRIPVFTKGVTGDHANEEDKGVTGDHAITGQRRDDDDTKGVTPDTQRRDPASRPSPHSPSVIPSTAARAGGAEALATIKEFTDDDEIAEILLELIAERKPRSLVAYTKKIAGNGGMNEWIERAYERHGEKCERAERELRAAFLAARQNDPPCEHGFPGGHVEDDLGWCVCPHQRAWRNSVPVGGNPWEA